MQIMCDWVTGVLDAGDTWLSSHGAWDSGKLHVLEPGAFFPHKAFGRRAVTEGSYSTRITWISRTGYDLEVSGNPAKFLQGHNLFGDSSARDLFFSSGFELRRLGVPFPSPSSYTGNDLSMRFTRVDFTRSYRFPSDELARSWLRAVGSFSRSRAGGAVNREGTLYFADGSSYWNLKVYLKSDEISSRRKGHGLPHVMSQDDVRKLHDWSEGVVRFEVTLRSRVLAKLGPVLDPAALWSEYFGRVDFMGEAVSSDAYLEDPRYLTLSPACRLAFAAWLRRDELVLQSLPRTTWFTYRKVIRGMFGVDIAVPRPSETSAPQEVGLDESRWDPEPIEALYYRPDRSLTSAYRDAPR